MPRPSAPTPSTPNRAAQARPTSTRPAVTRSAPTRPAGGSTPARPAAGSPSPAAGSARGVDITAAPRAVITIASELVNRFFGEQPSARDNAWQAVCADRERAAERAELASVLRDARLRRSR